MRITTSVWLVGCLALMGAAASYKPAAADPEKFTFELREMTAPQMIDEICRISGLQFQPDAEAARKLAASTRRTSSNLRDVPAVSAIWIALSSLGPDRAGLALEVNEPVVRLIQRPVNSKRLELATEDPKLPATLSAGPLRFEIKLLNLDPKQAAIRMSCNEPDEIRWLCNGTAAGWEPTVRLKSGKETLVFGRSRTHGKEIQIDGPIPGATPEDPPVALVWDIRWWKP